MDRRAWQATVHGVAKSWTWVRWFSTHSRISLLGVACAVGSSLHCICYPGLLCGRQNGCKRLLSHLESTNWNEEKWNDSWDRIRVGLSACRTLKQIILNHTFTDPICCLHQELCQVREAIMLNKIQMIKK